jgi:hypothetical protein
MASENGLTYEGVKRSHGVQVANGLFGRRTQYDVPGDKCPQCGGVLVKSSDECRGHCTACEQRGQ